MCVCVCVCHTVYRANSHTHLGGQCVDNGWKWMGALTFPGNVVVSTGRVPAYAQSSQDRAISSVQRHSATKHIDASYLDTYHFRWW